MFAFQAADAEAFGEELSSSVTAAERVLELLGLVHERGAA